MYISLWFCRDWMQPHSHPARNQKHCCGKHRRTRLSVRKSVRRKICDPSIDQPRLSSWRPFEPFRQPQRLRNGTPLELSQATRWFRASPTQSNGLCVFVPTLGQSHGKQSDSLAFRNRGQTVYWKGCSRNPNAPEEKPRRSMIPC